MMIKSISDAKTVLLFVPKDKTLRVYTNDDWTEFFEMSFLCKDRISYREAWFNTFKVTGECSLEAAANKLYRRRKWYNHNEYMILSKEGLK